MTQTPEQPEGTVPPPYSPAPSPQPYAPHPTTPSYSTTPPAPPAPPAPTGADATGLPSYGGATYSSGPAPTPPKARKTKLRVLGGVVAAIVVLGLKFGAVFGISALWHHSQHKAGDAEDVVDSALQSDTASGFTAELAQGVTLQKVIDPACFTTFQTATEYKIPKSHKNDDGSADVSVDFQDSDTDADVHLVQQSGAWRIDRITCS